MKIDVKTLEKLVWIIYKRFFKQNTHLNYIRCKRHPNKNRSVYSNKNGFSL